MKRIALRLVWIAIVTGGMFLLQLFTFNLQDSFQELLIQAGVAVILAVSLNLVNGFTGQFSIGHAGFMAVGAYTSAMFTLRLGVKIVPALHGGPLPLPPGVALLLPLVAGGALPAGPGPEGRAPRRWGPG